MLWTASGGQPHLVLPQVSRRPGVRGIALAPAGADPVRLQAALHLAYRLTRETTRPDEPVQVRVVSAVMPDTAEGLVRVPHLVTLRPDTGGASETAMWELLTVEAARRWLAAREADLAHIDANLPRLLALRTASRTGRIPPNVPPHLASLLRQQPAPLSTETVCRHLDLILHQVTRHHGGPA